MTLPLTGFRVIEFGNLIAAPYAAMLLADLGADVIKIEPLQGDLGRRFGPFIGEESAFFLAINRGKRSVVLDLKTEEGRHLALRLCATAHVVIHNLRHGVMERLGLSEPEVRADNSNVVYAVISAFGADGPYAERVGIDVIFQGESGMMSITGAPGSPPEKTATTIGDYVAATNAALAVCARLASGQGGRVDVSLRDGLLAVQSGWNALAFHSGQQPPKLGTASPFLAPNQVFESSDGHLTLAIVSDTHFDILCRTLGRPDLAAAYPTNDERMTRRAVLAGELQDVFASDTTEAWVELLTDAGIPAGRVLSIHETFADPQVVHNGMKLTLEHPSAGEIHLTGSPIRIDGSASVTDRPPPRLGEHTTEVLAHLDEH